MDNNEFFKYQLLSFSIKAHEMVSIETIQFHCLDLIYQAQKNTIEAFFDNKLKKYEILPNILSHESYGNLEDLINSTWSIYIKQEGEEKEYLDDLTSVLINDKLSRLENNDNSFKIVALPDKLIDLKRMIAIPDQEEDSDGEIKVIKKT